MATSKTLIELHKNQGKILQDHTRFKVIVAGRRFGKTTVALTELIKAAMENDRGKVWYVAPSYKQAKNIAWKMLLDMLPSELVAKTNETELSVMLKTGVSIELKGAENEDSLRGVGLIKVVMDEYQDIKPHVWMEIIRPTLIDTGEGSAIFIGTPKGHNHFFDLYEEARNPQQKAEETKKEFKFRCSQWSAYKFKTSDNPRIPASEIKATKNEYIARGQLDAYLQEYEAEFKRMSGLVYKMFSRETHVIDEITIQPEWTRALGIDFGYTNPTAVVFIAIDGDDNWYQYDELYKPGLSNTDRYNLIKQKMGPYNFIWQIADSASPDNIDELNALGLALQPVEKKGGTIDNWVGYKVQKFAERLAIREGTGKPKYFVTKNCRNTIWEFENYAYDIKPGTTDGREQPIKKDDHLMDAIGDLNSMYVATSNVNPNFGYQDKPQDDAW